jgi:hypothetical protein
LRGSRWTFGAFLHGQTILLKEDVFPKEETSGMPTPHLSFYYAYVDYLKNLSCLNHLRGHKRRALRFKASKYCLIKEGPGWRTPEALVLNCNVMRMFSLNNS